MISRRALLAAAACGIGATMPAWAQRGPFRIAWVSPSSEEDSAVFFQELRTGLRERGLIEGQNADLRPYWAVENAERLGELLSEFSSWKPDVIVAQGSASVLVGRAKTPYPAVFGYSGDPIKAGLVESIARPGGSMTGISYMTLELVGKRMELLKEVLPKAKHVAVIANQQHPGDDDERRASEAAAKSVGLEITYFEAARTAQQVEALAKIESASMDAVILFPIQSVIANRRLIAEWSMKTKIPTMSGWAQFVEGGNLMSYGPNLLAANRRLAAFTENILKGASPANLPVELPTRVELAINMKTAQSLGIAIPPSVLIRADNVIG